MKENLGEITLQDKDKTIIVYFFNVGRLLQFIAGVV